MKSIFWYFSLFYIIIGIVVISIFISESPSEMIIGEWTEKEWTYEVMDNVTYEKESDQNNDYKKLPNQVRDKIKQDILIHAAEEWRFYPDHRLMFVRENGDVVNAEWRLKGRGHILKIIYPGGKMEFYDIKELNDNELIINFDIGFEVRGVARLIFERRTLALSDAQKIQ